MTVGGAAPALGIITPPSMALMGGAGTGKTSSIATLMKAGIEVFFIGTEPNATDALFDSIKRLGLSMDKLHYYQVAPASAGWEAIEENVRLVKSMSYEALAQMTQSAGISKQKMDHLMDFIQALKNFPDERTGQRFGDVTLFDDSRALVIDSLSGLNKMAKEYVAGYSSALSPGLWGSAMSMEENILYKLCTDRSCYFVLIAHIDREIDEVQGGSRITISALGRKLGPQLIKNFSEVVLAKRDGANFYWSTEEANMDVKNRALGIGAKLPADFAQLVAAHTARKAQAAFVPAAPQAQGGTT